MRVHLGIVTEVNDAFLNQVKLCLYSFRKNAGALKDAPVSIITNSKPLPESEQKFFKEHFSPIEFKTAPRLGAIPHTSKLNVFYSIDPASYDVLMFMDCDTVVAKPLDDILTPIKNDGVQFLCRRGGETDRNRFLNFKGFISRFCGQCEKNISYKGSKEWSMFNTGVFLASSDAVQNIRKDSIEFTYHIFNQWQRNNAIENSSYLRWLYKLGILKSKQKVLESWTIEQGALALACIKSKLQVEYLDENYNSWGDLKDLRILHCFKSAYKFDRIRMYSSESEGWIKEYLSSGLPGKIFLAGIVQELKDKIPEINKPSCT